MSVWEVTGTIYSIRVPGAAEKFFLKSMETLAMGKIQRHTKNVADDNQSHDMSGLQGQY